LIFKVKIKQG